MFLHKLTQYQYDKICNGCGAKGVWLSPPKAKFFRKACDQHDLDYYLGYTERLRKKVDFELKFGMFRLVDREFPEKSITSWLQRRRYYTWCRLYFHVVRLFGKRHFFFGRWFQSLPRLSSEINDL